MTQRRFAAASTTERVMPARIIQARVVRLSLTAVRSVANAMINNSEQSASSIICAGAHPEGVASSVREGSNNDSFLFAQLGIDIGTSGLVWRKGRQRCVIL